MYMLDGFEPVSDEFEGIEMDGTLALASDGAVVNVKVDGVFGSAASLRKTSATSRAEAGRRAGSFSKSCMIRRDRATGI